MKTILCYGDSNTWGYNPETNSRFKANERWTNILSNILGDNYVIIEEGLNGRTTVWDDPLRGGFRGGRTYLLPCLNSHKPLDLVILFLGTNDLKDRFNLSPKDISIGIKLLVNDILNSGCGVNGNSPKILVLSPPFIEKMNKNSMFFEEFEHAYTKSRKLAPYIESVAKEFSVYFLDISLIAKTDSIDGLHFNKENHKKLAVYLADYVKQIL